MSWLKNKAAIITGAGSGIGRATAKLFAAQGAKVAILEKNRESGHEVANEIVSDGAQAEEAMAKATEALGGLDILVNNAATYIARGFFEISREEWQKVLDVNL